MKLITISGVDGSGKSTQVKMLQEYLEAQGRRVFYFHAIEFSIAAKLAGKIKKSGEAKSVTKANFLQIILRRFFLLIDIFRFKSLMKRLDLDGNDFILSDRYFYDSVINLNYLSGKDRTLPCEKFIPKPDVAIYLQVDPEQIMRRERKPDQGVEYLKSKNELFRNKVNAWKLWILDGNRDKNIIFEEIKKYVQQ